MSLLKSIRDTKNNTGDAQEEPQRGRENTKKSRKEGEKTKEELQRGRENTKKSYKEGEKTQRRATKRGRKQIMT